ncbi:MAG TPA: hypothetical protein VJT31_09785 [Rugosimonospora sp.]|nr:hypothetical protein [Rugosimonospora sp.]
MRRYVVVLAVGLAAALGGVGAVGASAVWGTARPAVSVDNPLPDCHPCPVVAAADGTSGGVTAEDDWLVRV